ncbi:unnamed protein product [Cuscuta campestris]|uniref:Uncharacterized protein n=1 Tax=Cuscuta campestris TaxID=132261 RepID=A0A484NAA6_9ASTE|nr:unnamed protein product [Cuscuta campestris]
MMISFYSLPALSFVLLYSKLQHKYTLTDDFLDAVTVLIVIHHGFGPGSMLGLDTRCELLRLLLGFECANLTLIS